jgi:hypothetical protein
MKPKFLLLSAPASWLFATGGGGKVRSRPRVLCAFIAAQRRALTGSPVSARPLPEAGALDEGRKLVFFLIAVRLCAPGRGATEYA